MAKAIADIVSSLLTLVAWVVFWLTGSHVWFVIAVVMCLPTVVLLGMYFVDDWDIFDLFD